MKIKPAVGNWYESDEWEAAFEVVAIDDDSHLIELQFFDGEIEEIDEETWEFMHIEEIAEPEDWRGACEVPKEDLIGYIDEGVHPEDWSGPLSYIEPEDNDYRL